MSASYDVIFLGLSITSSWGNGHATTYRGLVQELVNRGHNVLFLERDMPWYAMNRDMAQPPFGKTELYRSIDDLKQRFRNQIMGAEAVIVGSYVPDGVAIGEWVIQNAHGIRAFYDIDTPVTVAKLLKRDYQYITPQLVSSYDLYLSFAGGPILDQLEQVFGSPLARPLYCSISPDLYYPEITKTLYDLGYMGTYSADRQETLNKMFIMPALKWKEGMFIVAGPQYPQNLIWPENVTYIQHIAPSGHRQFYCAQKFTLNITREDMLMAGYAPSVRLFEAAACGTAIISDYWEGLGNFFKFGEEILISSTTEHTLKYLTDISEKERMSIGESARKRVLAEHTAAHRAQQLESYLKEAQMKKKTSVSPNHSDTERKAKEVFYGRSS
ncbi:MAG TPA: glycosyltransferase [Chitinispirillaceae bacterium]|nr:glycosyltransferase [Chitinispirillaceae bacterium]